MAEEPASAPNSPVPNSPVAAAEPSTVSDLTVDRIVDVIDFEVEHIMWERMSRLPHYEALAVRDSAVGGVQMRNDVGDARVGTT
jgi:hypothetical protein